ncbi:hypothetical protein L3556_00860 [Candidatus Synechococcus calcipolaris G9]|uniref:Uncharacterized protein n=1 Tax=Candidatus Synechococcus calcipolaris G9 TaxID=1497997 RepID=A0ABT6EUC6_9SYNE|nr:hypothetical protein [Candidatus Synechococcus calcipolaris]MDG2989488.1 hypothetical protein [Candidatus Synechococcus calcipolaris G9]
MAPIISRQVVEYKSDLIVNGQLHTIKKLRFKMKEGKLDPFTDCAQIEMPDSVCGSASILKPRAVVVTFNTGERIRFPIDEPSKVPTCIAVLSARDDVICVDLDGEEWRVIPPSLTGGGTPNATPYSLPTGAKSEKLTGGYDYTSDVMGQVRYKYAVELLPDAISSVILTCLENTGPKDACTLPIPGFRPRHLTLKANRERTPGEPNSPMIARKVPVSSVTGVAECAEALAPLGLCLSYKGESIRNAHNLIGDPGSGLIPI